MLCSHVSPLRFGVPDVAWVMQTMSVLLGRCFSVLPVLLRLTGSNHLRCIVSLICALETPLHQGQCWRLLGMLLAEPHTHDHILFGKECKAMTSALFVVFSIRWGMCSHLS